MEPVDRCERCEKPRNVCVCERITAHPNRTEVLVLQHPSEKNELLGTAKFLELGLTRVVVRPGLSWAGLSAALGREVDPRDWAVLFRGSLPAPLTPAQLSRRVLRLDRHGREMQLRPPPRGLIVLDATWQRAKTMWWRNPWLLKLQRIVLHPEAPSIYGRLRREPDRGALSTLEAVVETLLGFGEDAAIGEDLRRVMRTFAQRVRDSSTGVGSRARPSAKAARQRRGARRGGARGGGPLD